LDFLGKWGCHTFRKTAYLFGVWGGGQDSDLMLSARHKTIQNAMKYKQDASFLLAIALENDMSLTIAVPKWRSIYIQNHQAAVALNHNSIQRVRNKTILGLCVGFVQQLNVGPIDSWKRKFIQVGKELLQYSESLGRITDIKKEITDVLNTLEKSKADKLAKLLQLYDLQQTTMTATSSETSVVNSVVTTSIEPEPVVTDNEQARTSTKRKRGGEQDIPNRLLISKIKNPSEKLTAILACIEQSEVIPAENRTEALSKFLQDVVYPIHSCYNQHFESDSHRFLEFHKEGNTFYHAKFRLKRCRGGSVCGTIN
jgi:hypothetical protein